MLIRVKCINNKSLYYNLIYHETYEYIHDYNELDDNVITDLLHNTSSSGDILVKSE